MSSSAYKQQQPNMHGGATSAPPPTPSTQPNNLLSTSSGATADALSRLLHRLPPTLSLPKRRSPPSTCPPSVSLSDVQANPSTLFSSSSQLGFFQLTNHSVLSQLANSAESEALSLFNLPRHQKESFFTKCWPLGFEGDDDDEDDDGDSHGESFCLDSSCSTESIELCLTSLREFTRALEKVGLEIVELLCRSAGFENPLGKDDPTRFSSMMWISEVGLQYQIRSGQKYSLLADSGWVSVLPPVESILVTIGDIAQVWSNGKFKKVRGRAVACLGEGECRCISMSLLVTLPIDSTSRVGPLVPISAVDGGHDEDRNDRDDDDGGDQNLNGKSDGEKEGRLFKSFSLEDYAWRVYHERLFLKDPLDRYRFN
ncbi:unnamed protein product [Prunus armeniaca]|uniref:Non-haem dioxygenase N-terminal domain-containing protein n=1 Tax=Prunus armeniaca TaxID=36596 RepID=A0A6J5U745_PRUAR|nr:unnamed protein product [Prunus armeniaca]